MSLKCQDGGSLVKESIEMKCSIVGCPGEYEERKIMHSVPHQGQVIVIHRVPAEVCLVRGDIPLKPETGRRPEKLLEKPSQTSETVALDQYS